MKTNKLIFIIRWIAAAAFIFISGITYLYISLMDELSYMWPIIATCWITALLVSPIIKSFGIVCRVVSGELIWAGTYAFMFLTSGRTIIEVIAHSIVLFLFVVVCLWFAFVIVAALVFQIVMIFGYVNSPYDYWFWC